MYEAVSTKFSRVIDCQKALQKLHKTLFQLEFSHAEKMSFGKSLLNAFQKFSFKV